MASSPGERATPSSVIQAVTSAAGVTSKARFSTRAPAGAIRRPASSVTSSAFAALDRMSARSACGRPGSRLARRRRTAAVVLARTASEYVPPCSRRRVRGDAVGADDHGVHLARGHERTAISQPPACRESRADRAPRGQARSWSTGRVSSTQTDGSRACSCAARITPSAVRSRRTRASRCCSASAYGRVRDQGAPFAPMRRLRFDVVLGDPDRLRNGIVRRQRMVDAQARFTAVGRVPFSRALRLPSGSR